jgi:hypothetical protein
MNDKIKELAVRSGVVEAHVDWEAAGGNLLEKFAELIINECLEACSIANDIRHFVPPTQQQVVLSCMDEIEMKFRS